MFGNFLTLLGVSGDSESDKPQAAQNTPEDQRRESDRRRDLILQLATYLSAVKVKSSTQKRIVESVRQVSEVVIWSDRRNPELLSYVVEVNLHRALLRLLQDRRGGNASVAVAVQVLQTLSIILDGITESRFLYSLFSNNFVNELIAAPVDLENDEILAYYVAFLKALSLKLTTDTIHFFFNERLDDFPLYTTAISLFDHPDSMVRVAVRAITLNVFRINDQDALEFILSAPACAHFWQMIMRALKDCYDDAFRILVDMPTVTPRLQTAPIATSVVDNRMSEIQEWAAVDQILENHMGLLSYMNDIYGLGVERINQRITSEFLDRILIRTFVHVIEIGWRAGASPEEALFMQVVTLFLSHFFAIIKYSPLLVDTINALFVEQVAHTSDDSNAMEEGEEGAKMEEPTHLVHPFTPSPFEASRTLMPWMCVALEILHNKAIGPTVLVRSVLTPRRMLRTRALLDSLTGRPAVADCRSSSGGSALSVLPSIANATSAMSTSDGLTSDGALSPPPAHTQAIITALVQILTESPPSHNWATISLAALLLTQLAAGPRSRIILDGSLSEELTQAQAKHSAEIRAMLLSADEPPTSIGDVMSNAIIACGSWKALVKCLVDVANSNAETLQNKIESESRHIFSLDRLASASPTTTTGLQSPQIKAHMAPKNRRSSASSSTFNPPPPPLPPRISLSSSRTSLATAPSPFDSETPQDTALLAAIYQAHYLRRLAISAGRESGGKAPPPSNYSGDLMAWLGKEAGVRPADSVSATVVDNLAKRALPKGTLRLGFSAHVACTSGHLLVYHQDEATPELVWPLADVTIVTIDMSCDSTLPSLRIVDTEFPDFFFAARPKQLGGINVNAGTPTTFADGRRRGDSHRPKLLPYSYVSSRQGLDISMKFADKTMLDATASMLRKGVLESRKLLAGIYLNHSVI